MKNRLISVILIALCLISVVIGFNNKNLNYKSTKTEKSQKFMNIFSEGDKIALISIEGPIQSDASESFIGNKHSAESARIALKRALKDKSVKAVLLRINSPGGTVGMSQEIYSNILKLREKKPVVVSMGDIAASGGYYIASAGDRIVAYPGTLTGSIGVILNTYNANELLTKKLGIQPQIIKSGKYKDIASPYRALEQDEKQLLQSIINSTYKQFVSAIVSARINRNDSYNESKKKLTYDNIKKYADGRIFNGEQAYNLGFVDKLGTLNDAQSVANNMAKEKFGIKKQLPLVPYNVPSGFGELFFGAEVSSLKKLFKVNVEDKLMPYSMNHPNKPILIWE